MGLNNKIKQALVLCATDGLGLAVAQRLYEQGCQVTITGRNLEKARQVAESISSDVQTLSLDLDSKDSILSFYEHLQANGSYDILVNNTGGPKASTLLEVESVMWEQYFQSMVLPVFETSRLLIPYMQSQQWGRIINLTSSGVIQPIPNLGISNALRSTIVGWAKSLATELAAEGITVNTVAPGRIDTKRVQYLDSVNAKKQSITELEAKTASVKKIPMGRYGKPSEFAALVGFLASDEAAYITGSVHRLDGGLIQSV